jgi:hypothetical protein
MGMSGKVGWKEAGEGRQVPQTLRILLCPRVVISSRSSNPPLNHSSGLWKRMIQEGKPDDIQPKRF